MRSPTRILTVLIATASLAGTACIRRVKEPELLHVNDPIPTKTLVGRINSYSDVETFSAQSSIYVKAFFGASDAAEYPAGNLSIRLQRPDRIRMLVTAPAPLTRSIADMTSDGKQFRLAIYYPTDKRAFIYGSNLGDYKRMNEKELKDSADARLRNAGALANIRPQHVTDAFLVRPIKDDGRTQFFREELTQLEPEDRAAKKGRIVRRTYYVVYVLDRLDDGKNALRRKFWFDRTKAGTPLVRQQTFENGEGKLGSDISYIGDFAFDGNKRSWPGTTVIERLNDGYSISVEVDSETLRINSELPSTAFVLENYEQMKAIDLDEPGKAEAESQRKRPSPSAKRAQKHLRPSAL